MEIEKHRLAIDIRLTRGPVPMPLNLVADIAIEAGKSRSRQDSYASYRATRIDGDGHGHAALNSPTTRGGGVRRSGEMPIGAGPARLLALRGAARATG